MAKMTEFDYEVRDRKRLARMAVSKKNGSKSKKCSLPSDGMTKKQWKERCGEVMSFNIKKPMSWEQFKTMSHDLQREYVTSLTTTYKVGLQKVADMLGCCEASLRYYLKKYVPDFVSGAPGGRPKKEDVDAWAEFLCGKINECNQEGVKEPDAMCSVSEVSNAMEQAVEPAGDMFVEEAADGENAFEEKLAEKVRKKLGSESKSMLREFSLIFEGDVNPMEIANSIVAILGAGAAGRVEVRYAM